MAGEDTQNDGVEVLLPFYVNGTLEPEGRARVEAALRSDPALNSELQALLKLRETMQELDFGQSPGQFGLARVLRDIDKLEPLRPQKMILPWTIAVAAVAALVAVAAAWVTDLRDPEYSLASGGSDGEHLRVAFQPTATQSEISDLLLELDLEISSGPTAIGLYSLVSDPQSDLNALAVQLRNRQDLIESVDMP